VFSNLTTTQVSFPVGTSTSFLPVRINNGSGHTFSAGVKTGFTVAPPGTQHVLREWDITDVTGGAVSATLTLQWNAADEDPTFNRAACTMMHYSSVWSLLGSTGAATGTNPYTKTTTGVTTFSPFGVTSNKLALPVKLTYFKALKEDSKVKLTWETADEISTSHFEIEKSTDGIRYASMGKINALNTSGTHSYSANDNVPSKGINLYRLKMVDVDRKEKYSHIVRVDFNKKVTVFVFPNPAQDEMIIQSDKDVINLDLFDVNGKLIKQFKPSASNRYNISDIMPGTYFVKIINNDAADMVTIVKQ